MIKSAINYLLGQLELNPLFKKVYPFAGLVRDDKGTYPAVYIGGSDQKSIELDENFSMCYLRMRGNVDFNVNTEKKYNIISCKNDIFDIRVPVRLVCFISKSIDDDSCKGFEDLTFAQNILGELSNYNLTSNSTGAKHASLMPDQILTDNFKLLSDEYGNNAPVDFNYEYSYFAIDFVINFVANKDCFACVTPDYTT